MPKAESPSQMFIVWLICSNRTVNILDPIKIMAIANSIGHWKDWYALIEQSVY